MGYMKKGTREKIEETLQKTIEDTQGALTRIEETLRRGEYITMEYERRLRLLWIGLAMAINMASGAEHHPLHEERLDNAIHEGWHKRWRERDRRKKERERRKREKGRVRA